MINVGIVGATGYAGEELVDILLRHPDVRITHISAKIDQPRTISEIFPKFKGRIELLCQLPNVKDIVEKCNLVFLALPHTISMTIAPDLLKHGLRVIDLSADYRLKDASVYKKFYHVRQSDLRNLS
jgi:N-acetyl-gamma-glutamyl-phosphate reductase